MYKHTVEYVDFNGNERKEDLYFHLSSPELLRLEAEIGMPMMEFVKKLNMDGDVNKLLSFIEKILLLSYGVKSHDGRTFLKNQEVKSEFEHSQAYAEIFEQMLLNPDIARKFGEAVADNGKVKKNTVDPKVVS